MLDRIDSYKIIDYIIKNTKDYKTSVLINGQAQGLTRFANSTIHQNVFEDSVEVNIQAILDGKKGEITTSDLSEKGLDLAIEQLKENLELSPVKEHPPLVRKPLLSEVCSYKSDLVKNYGVNQRAIHLKEAFELLPKNYLAYGIYSLTTMLMAYGNSNHVKRYLKTNYVKLNTLISDGNDGTAFYSTLSQDPKDLIVTNIFNDVINRVKLNRDRKSIDPGEYTVILEPAAVANILMYLSFAGFSAKSVQDNYSFLSNKIGEKVFDEKVTIVDDWHNHNTMPLPFDMEGYERKQLNIIENGVAKDLAYDSLSAYKEETKSTGHSVSMPDRGGIPLNIVMEGGEKTLDQIIKETDQAILISRFHYMNIVNPRTAQLTALTRDGLFNVKNGEISHALENMRFTESILEAFNNIVEISKDRKRIPTIIGNYYVPAIKINNFKFTGKTKS
jgi:predicted Zn-dependent protease